MTTDTNHDTPGGPAEKCDSTPIRSWLIGAGGAITASAACVAAAAVANGSFFAAWTSPGWMAAAGAFASAGVACLGQADGAVDTHCACLSRAGKNCGECRNCKNLIKAMMTVVGIDASACFGNAAIAWIPWAPQPAMWTIFGSLVAQGALVPAVVSAVVGLEKCAFRSVPANERAPEFVEGPI